MEDFGARLRSERIRLGFSQSGFARVLGQTRETQGRYETGKRVPDARYLQAAGRVGVDLLFLLNGTADIPRPAKKEAV
jgi:transcriptional regulator with XRE-family HTH domain